MKLPRIPVVLAWLILSSGSILPAQGNKNKIRKVLPLEHHLGRNLNERSLRNLQADNSEQEPTFNSQASAQKSGNSAGGNSAQQQSSFDGRSRGGGGFLGDGLNSITQGRAASHDGGSQVHPNPPGPAPHMPGSKPGPAPHYKSATKYPTYSPVYYPDGGGKGKGKGSSKHSKSKSKSKGKGKGKGDRSYYEPGGSPIDGGNMGADDIHGPTPDGGGGDPPGPSPPDVVEPQTIDLTPFGILFELADGLGTPTSDEYAMAIDVTVGYLNTYMNLQYEGMGLQEFVTTATSTIYRDGVPQIDFTAQATFQSNDPPSMEALDERVAQAFTGANLALYLSMLQNLPAENKFSTTTGARLTNPVDLGGRRSSLIGNVSTPGIAGAIGAGAFVIVAIGFMIYGKEKNRRKRLPSCPAAATAAGETNEQTALRPKPGKRPRTKAQILQDQLLRRYNPDDDEDESGTSMEDTTTCSDDSTIIAGLSRLIPSFKAKAKIPSSIPLNKSVPIVNNNSRTKETPPSPTGMSPLEGDDES